MAVTVTNKGLKIGDREVPLFCGAVHYWRLDRSLWDEILDEVVELGFSIIDTYIPWSVHETAPGSFDFGENDSRKDVGAFLDLCAEKKIHVLVRPGPHINSELTFFGYPERVLTDPHCQSKTAKGTPVTLPVPPRAFFAPSYASHKFYDEVATWFDAICPILEKRIHPNGAVIAAQADNEMSLFFRTSAYDHDYSDGAKRLFHEFLEKRYADISELNKVYGSRHRHFEDVPMLVRYDAKDKDDLPKYLDWAAYKEHHIEHGIATIAKMLKERGVVDVPITHNWPTPLQHSPFNTPSVERLIDIQGFDMYPTRKSYEQLKAGCLMATAQSRLPFIPEFGAGGWVHMVPLTFEDQSFSCMVALMHGVKAISHYMIVERERWYGSPIARDGRRREPNFSFYKKLNSLIRAKKLNELDRENGAILMNVRSYQRHDSASTILDPLTPIFTRLGNGGAELECSEEKLGFESAIPIAYERWTKKCLAALKKTQLPYVVGDTDMDAAPLKKYPLMIAPTFEYLGAREQTTLVEYAMSGGLLVIGPKIPELDERMAECDTIKSKLDGNAATLDGVPGAKMWAVGEGKIVLVPSLGDDNAAASALEALAKTAGLSVKFMSLDPEVEVSFHSSGDGKGVLYVANPTHAAREAKIKLDADRKLKDLWNGESFGGSEIKITMPAYTVRMLEVE